MVVVPVIVWRFPRNMCRSICECRHYIRHRAWVFRNRAVPVVFSLSFEPSLPRTRATNGVELKVNRSEIVLDIATTEVGIHICFIYIPQYCGWNSANWPHVLSFEGGRPRLVRSSELPGCPPDCGRRGQAGAWAGILEASGSRTQALRSARRALPLVQDVHLLYFGIFLLSGGAQPIPRGTFFFSAENLTIIRPSNVFYVRCTPIVVGTMSLWFSVVSKRQDYPPILIKGKTFGDIPLFVPNFNRKRKHFPTHSQLQNLCSIKKDIWRYVRSRLAMQI